MLGSKIQVVPPPLPVIVDQVVEGILCLALSLGVFAEVQSRIIRFVRGRFDVRFAKPNPLRITGLSLLLLCIPPGGLSAVFFLFKGLRLFLGAFQVDGRPLELIPAAGFRVGFHAEEKGFECRVGTSAWPRQHFWPAGTA